MPEYRIVKSKWLTRNGYPREDYEAQIKSNNFFGIECWKAIQRSDYTQSLEEAEKSIEHDKQRRTFKEGSTVIKYV